MDKIRIEGGRRLDGAIRLSGAKNAALPLMAASLLTDRPLVLHRVPRLADIATLAQLLAQHGVEVAHEPGDPATNGGAALTLMSPSCGVSAASRAAW